MPDSTPKVFKIHRFQIGLNVLIQTLLVLFIIVAANYFAFRHYQRWDLSRDHEHTLADQTQRLLRGLKSTVHIVVFFPDDSSITGDLDSLLKEFQYASRSKIEVEKVDPARDLARARELSVKYKFGNENVVVVDCNDRSKVIPASDLVDMDESVAMFNQAPTIRDFKGEQALASALLEVTEPEQAKVYVLTGDGEPELDDPALKLLSTYIGRQNLALLSLNLASSKDGVPADAKTVLIAGAKYDLNETEIKALDAYWQKKGRLFIALDPTAFTPKLDNFVKNIGLVPQDDRVLKTVNLGPVAVVQRNVAASYMDGSPITRRLKNINTALPGNTQSIKLDSATASAGQTKLQGLMLAADGYWGETKYTADVNQGGSYTFLPSEDHAPPLTLAATAEKGAVADESSRLFLAGNADFLQSDALTQVGPNVDFIVGALNWLVDREELIGVPPRLVQNFTLNITDAQVSRLALFALVIIPAGAAFIGLGTWLQRRR
ncbi:MAG: Gldg family protein [Chthoniobacteraceae bacterium]